MYETDIVQMSKSLAASLVEDLTGQEDPTPFQIVKDANDALSIALVHIPEAPEDRDKMADFLTAACCVHRAIEATFLSAAWSSVYSSVADVDKERPAERPNRVEVVTLIHVTRKRVETHTAAILRVDGRVELSPWIADPENAFTGAGRIPAALQWGIELAERMPQDVIDALDAARESLPTGRIVELFVKQIGEVRDWRRAMAERN